MEIQHWEAMCEEAVAILMVIKREFSHISITTSGLAKEMVREAKNQGLELDIGFTVWLRDRRLYGTLPSESPLRWDSGR